MRRVLYVLRQFGFDPIKFVLSIGALPRFIKELIKFKRLQSQPYKFQLLPSLVDYYDQAGSADGHYFWQDLICAQWISADVPQNHLDVGSRVDGFIAHLLSFRDVTQMDIRKLDYEIPRLTSVQADLQSPKNAMLESFDSVSSLHSLEHFGLGRYGDPLDPEGHKLGLINLAAFVQAEGLLYVSFPIGKPMVQFNSQRIIDPNWPVEVLDGFDLMEFVVIPWRGVPLREYSPSNVNLGIKGQAGLYKFRRKVT